MSLKEHLKNIVEYLQKILRKTGFLIKECGLKLKNFIRSIPGILRKLPRKVWIWVAVSLVAIAGMIYVLTTVFEIINPESLALGKPAVAGKEYNVDKEFSKNMVNIALLGFDRDSEREEHAYLFLPDFIAVVTIDFKKDAVTFVRIPRDSYVPIYYTGIKDKINHSYFHGYHYGKGKDHDADGLLFTLETASLTLGGIPIHYYATVDMDGVVQIVNAMGGVWYDVEEDLCDRHGNIKLAKGPQHLMGEQFLTYVRHRDDRSGQDMGRLQRQFDILMATFNYYKEYDLFKNIPVTFKVYRDYIDTNLTFKQVAALAYYARDIKLTDEKVRFYPLKGDSQTKDGIWYWVLNQAQRVRLIKEAYGLTVSPWPQEVLKDTPPSPIKFFEGKVAFDKDGKPSVSLSWEPGDTKNVHYELYRGDTLLGSMEECFYVDKNVQIEKTYTYRLVVYHYRASGSPANLTVSIYPEEPVDEDDDEDDGEDDGDENNGNGEGDGNNGEGNGNGDNGNGNNDNGV